VIVTDTQFVGNTATEAGGGLFFEGGAAHITGSRFVGNTASQDGGGAYIGLGGALTTLTNPRQDSIDTQFLDNRAQRGGGLFINGFVDAAHTGVGVVENALFAQPCDRGRGDLSWRCRVWGRLRHSPRDDRQRWAGDWDSNHGRRRSGERAEYDLCQSRRWHPAPGRHG
jgi:hypothetical protein